MTAAMTEDTNTQSEEGGRAPSEPAEDPKVHPAPPGNPDVNPERVQEAEEGLEEVVGR